MTVVLIISLDLKRVLQWVLMGNERNTRATKIAGLLTATSLFIFFWGDVTVILQDKSTIPISIILIFTWETCNIMVNFQLYAWWGFSLKLTDALRYVLTLGFELLVEGLSFLLSYVNFFLFPLDIGFLLDVTRKSCFVMRVWDDRPFIPCHGTYPLILTLKKKVYR